MEKAFRATLAWAPPVRADAAPLGRPGPARRPAGWKKRQGSGADDRLLGPGGAFRCGQSAGGVSGPPWPGPPSPRGGGAPGMAKTSSLPGKVGKPTGGGPADPAGNDQILGPARRPGSERHGRCKIGARTPKKEGGAAAPRSCPGRSGGGSRCSPSHAAVDSGLPSPCLWLVKSAPVTGEKP